MQNNNLFFNYLAAEYVANKLNIDREELILRAMQRQVNFYYPVKSSKAMHFIPRSSTKKPLVLFLYLVWGKISAKWLPQTLVTKGEMILLNLQKHIDLLAKNILTEKDVFFLDEHKNSLLLDFFITTRNQFHSISFSDIYILPSDAQALKQKIANELAEILDSSTSGTDDDIVQQKETKQTKREKIFLDWLQDKDELEISQMKKEDVWSELKQLDHGLFSVEPKNFFRDQKIITFKSGRKSELES